MTTIEDVFKKIQSTLPEQSKLHPGLPALRPTEFGGPYGMFDVVSRYAGLSSAPFPHEDGDWVHGWTIEAHNDDFFELTGHKELKTEAQRNAKWWVWRGDQESALTRGGYRNVRAVASPLCYVPKPDVQRIPGSILLMPIHGDLSGKYRWNENRFALYAKELKRKYNVVSACIYPMDYIMKNWITTLRAEGISIVSGALWCDTYALNRMAFLFSRYEVVVSNGFGSHLLYPHFFGARSCIAEDAGFAEHDTAYSQVRNQYSEEKVRKLFGFLFKSPSDAVLNREWALHELGWKHRLPPQEVQECFGWTCDKEKAYHANRIRVARDTWVYGRHLSRLGFHREAAERFAKSRSLMGSSFAVGSDLYKVVCKVFGPRRAEDIIIRAKSIRL